MSDHMTPYAPVVASLLAAHPDTVTPQDLSTVTGGLWNAYWRRREFNRLRHTNPFPRIHLFRSPR